MYVRVHKEGDQWFRDDNRALVGKTHVEAGDEKMGEALIATDKDDGILAIYGYLDKNIFLSSFASVKLAIISAFASAIPAAGILPKVVHLSAYISMFTTK